MLGYRKATVEYIEIKTNKGIFDMRDIANELQILLTTEVFKALKNSEFIQFQQLTAAQSLLIKLGIPFDVDFSPGTNRKAAAVELTVYINPSVKIQFILSFESGGTIFGG